MTRAHMRMPAPVAAAPRLGVPLRSQRSVGGRAGPGLPPSAIVAVQRSAGNRAASALARSRLVQRMEMQDCSGQKKAEVQAAHASAANMLVTAEKMARKGSDPLVQAAAKRHFGITLPASTNTSKKLWFGGVRTALTTLKTGITDASYECEPKQNWKNGGCIDRGIAVALFNIHLCPGWHGLSPDERAFVLVHEWGHKFARGVNRVFETYCSDSSFAGLSASDRVEQPDAYASFVLELATGTKKSGMCT